MNEISDILKLSYKIVDKEIANSMKYTIELECDMVLENNYKSALKILEYLFIVSERVDNIIIKDELIVKLNNLKQLLEDIIKMDDIQNKVFEILDIIIKNNYRFNYNVIDYLFDIILFNIKPDIKKRDILSKKIDFIIGEIIESKDLLLINKTITNLVYIKIYFKMV